jgi:hypothetical protein
MKFIVERILIHIVVIAVEYGNNSDHVIGIVQLLKSWFPSLIGVLD